ncbi:MULTISPECIES: bifunctional nicotinamidase/pyrazinamidase [Methylobacterium]|uniref:nicotinamidase n=1 Tax=Methylobacterium thuringiense TaxID=1003091 RepID=A0ABQ4TKL0_9HYPH|nr:MULTISPECIES: bifunctional nicotinamidase/pyrazinamidase [Methylobacterium]TXN20931.1 bifunctional nicotinamidase/pyrazinamidase [Methylobacterium sp. WL9]GJE55874.1 Nicotinamidase [Methylobacterium thuringiense]
MRFTEGDVLVVVDVQNDFLPGGALAVPDGDAVIAPINRLVRRAPHVVVTQDWHPAGHASFAAQHPERAPFETVPMPYGEQVLWPDHCVQGTHGAELAAGLDLDRAELILRKGTRSGVDSYSAFMEADRKTRTGLAGYLCERGLTRLVLTGLATDFCILWTALDARAEGFAVAVVEDAVRGIDRDGSVSRAWYAMCEAGVDRIDSREIQT